MIDACLEKEIATPYFFIHEDKIDKLVSDLFGSLHMRWKDGIVGYSFKTNNLPWIINYMKDKGLYAEVVSSDEFNLALELGFDTDKIIFNGPVKGKDEFIKALKGGSIVNIDSKRELEWLKECEKINAKVGLRVNFDLESMCPNESQCGEDDGRFGFSYETGEFEKALNFLIDNNIKLDGLHLHCSSKTRSLNIYKAIAKMAVRIVKEYGLILDYVDIGGGFFGGMPNKPCFEDYLSNVKAIFDNEERLKTTNLIVEPGMSVIGSTIDYVTSVVDVKRTKHNRFVLLDGSRTHIDPLMRKSGYTYYVEKCDEKERMSKDEQILCGFTCMENDRFFRLKDEEELKTGDKVIFEKVGAYTMGLSPLFIQFFPAVYAKDKNNKIVLARKKWTAKDFNM